MVEGRANRQYGTTLMASKRRKRGACKLSAKKVEEAETRC